MGRPPMGGRCMPNGLATAMATLARVAGVSNHRSGSSMTSLGSRPLVLRACSTIVQLFELCLVVSCFGTCAKGQVRLLTVRPSHPEVRSTSQTQQPLSPQQQ
jgi:hypothetical protein